MVKKTPEPTPEPVEEQQSDPGDDAQCPALNDEGTRCLFVVHEGDDHAFTEEDAAAAEAAAGDGTASAVGEALDAMVVTVDGGDAPEDATEALPASRVTENAWWCGKPGCDTAMPHSMDVCAKCKTPRVDG